MTTRHDVQVAEDDARSRIERIDHPEREGWACLLCDPDDVIGPATWLVRDPDPMNGAAPVCDWHAAETVHDAIPYGANCSRCGKDHSALWPDEEPLFPRGGEWCLHCGSDTCEHAARHNAAYGGAS